MAADDPKCALPGCSKASHPSLHPDRPHLTCGKLHHLLLMAARFHSHLELPAHQQIFDRNAAGLCAFPSCSRAPEPAHSWCSRSHMLSWLSKFTSSLRPDQICQLPGCTRHVFVAENSSCWQYCGWRHWQKHVMQSARQKVHLQDQKRSSPCAVQVLVPGESPIQNLTDYVLHGITPSGIILDEDFFYKHPWDVCIGDGTSWIITLCKGTGKKKGERVTKDGYHWKQQGRPVRKKLAYTVTYFTYKKLGSKQNDGGSKYFLEQYMSENVDRFVILKLRKGSARRRHRKGKECSRGEADEKKDAEAGEKIDAGNAVMCEHDSMDMDSSVWDCLSPLTCYEVGEYVGLHSVADDS